MKHLIIILIFMFVIAGLFTAFQSQLTTTKESSLKLERISRISENAPASLAGVTGPSAQNDLATHHLKEVFFQTDLKTVSAESVDAIRRLEKALVSKNLNLRDEALAQTKSLLIQFSHQKLKADSLMQAEFAKLFRTFKREGKELILQISQVNPDSPTLTYLSKL